jgi:hypothetical protein
MRLTFRALVTGALAVWTGLAAATTAADSLGPSDLFDESVGWVVGGGAYLWTGVPYDNLPAARFASAATGEVTRISAPLQHWGPPLAPVYFQIRDDDAGRPGVVLGQSLVSASTTLEVRAVDFDAGVRLEQGRSYWFSIDSTDPLTAAAWHNNVLGITGPLLVLDGPLSTPGDGVWAGYWNVTQGAFRVEVAAIPEPSHALLLLLGLPAVLASAGRRRR